MAQPQTVTVSQSTSLDTVSDAGTDATLTWGRLKKRAKLARGRDSFENVRNELEDENFSQIFQLLHGKLDSQALVIKKPQRRQI